MTCRLSKTRDVSLDNIRFFLILTVVLGHLLRICQPFTGRWLLYQLIYTFHMPAFIFLFGYNAKFSPKRILTRWCFPYIVFQVIYIAFANAVLKDDIAFQFTTPYWLLWYLLAGIYFQLLLPLFDTADPRRQLMILLCTFLIALGIGFVDSIGYFLSLSRLFVFLPWFLMGYYCKKNDLLTILSAHKKTQVSVLLISAAIIALSLPYLHYGNIPRDLLFGGTSYAVCGGTVWMRGATMILSLSWILFLFVGIKPYLNRKFFLVTRIGQNTLPVFLLHGFITRSTPLYFPYFLDSPLGVLLLTCAILVLFGNKIANKALYYLCFSWVERILPSPPITKESE